MSRNVNVTPHLFRGKNGAIPGRELAKLLNCTARDISESVEYERRHGSPILASCRNNRPGYYLAETAEEIEQYCGGLHKRAGEIFKTRRALLATAEKMRAEAGEQ